MVNKPDASRRAARRSPPSKPSWGCVCASLPPVSSLVMPLVCKDMVDILDVGVNSTSANHASLSNFAFLYGVFPTAPSVALYAGHYSMELEVVSPLHNSSDPL